MKCNEAIDKFADYLAGELDPAERREMDAHLAGCPACATELRGLSETWVRLGVLPEERPSAGLRNRFYEMLEEAKNEVKARERAETEARRSRSVFGGAWFRQPLFQFATAAALVVLGVVVGAWIVRPAGGGASVAQLREEVQGVRQTLAVSLLRQDSAFARLEGVGLSRQLNAPGQDFLDALFQTLDNDPNVNVRLAVVDALYLYSGRPGVRERVLLSLDTQQSPLVQAALIDLLVGMRERRAVESLRRLLQEQNLSPQIRQRAQQGIAKLEA